MYKFCWAMWIGGTILIVASWVNVVSITVGWVGFGIALAGTLISRVAHHRLQQTALKASEIGPENQTRKSLLEPFTDPVLGELKPDEMGWTVNVSKGQDSFQFTIGGRQAPDNALLAHAHDIFNDYESFKRSVRNCIETESRDYPEEVKAELARLQIDDIALFWPDRPEDGMIFFRGSENDVGLWRCDYIGRKPTHLGCDT
jgi:hypothetical protein